MEKILTQVTINSEDDGTVIIQFSDIEAGTPGEPLETDIMIEQPYPVIKIKPFDRKKIILTHWSTCKITERKIE